MVEPIGIKTGAAVERRTVSAGHAAKAVAPAQPVKGATEAASTSTAAGLSRAMASQAPVDAERVSKIKKAIEDGRFPLVPSTIADRLLALKLQWNPNDPA